MVDTFEDNVQLQAFASKFSREFCAQFWFNSSKLSGASSLVLCLAECSKKVNKLTGWYSSVWRFSLLSQYPLVSFSDHCDSIWSTRQTSPHVVHDSLREVRQRWSGSRSLPAGISLLRGRSSRPSQTSPTTGRNPGLWRKRPECLPASVRRADYVLAGPPGTCPTCWREERREGARRPTEPSSRPVGPSDLWCNPTSPISSGRRRKTLPRRQQSRRARWPPSVPAHRCRIIEF